MRFLCYANTSRREGKRLRAVMKESFPREGTEFYRALGTFSSRLSQPRGEKTIALLLALSARDLYHILAVAHLLNDVAVLLVLPDRKKGTLAHGHSLRPRFITYADSDFSDLIAVLNRMKRREERTKEIR